MLAAMDSCFGVIRPNQHDKAYKLDLHVWVTNWLQMEYRKTSDQRCTGLNQKFFLKLWCKLEYKN